MMRVTSADCQKLLYNLRVVVLGDSNGRAIYKDLVTFYKTDQKMSNEKIKASFDGQLYPEETIRYKSRKDVTGSNFKEERVFKTESCVIEYLFIHRAWDSYVATALDDLFHPNEQEWAPDVIIINSCIWDMSSYHLASCEYQYVQRLYKLCRSLDEKIPVTCLVIWYTNPPVSRVVYNQCGNCQRAMGRRNLVLEMTWCNHCIHRVASAFSMDVLDLNWLMRDHTRLRAKDGIHWLPDAHRIFTAYFLARIADARCFLGPAPTEVVGPLNVAREDETEPRKMIEGCRS